MNEKDKKIEELLKQVCSKKDKIEKAKKVPFRAKTTQLFSFNPRNTSCNNRINLNIAGENELIEIASFLCSVRAGFKQFNSDHSDQEFPYDAGDLKWTGFLVDDYLEDVAGQLKKRSLKKEENNLAALEQELTALMSSDHKAKKRLEEISSLLS